MSKTPVDLSHANQKPSPVLYLAAASALLGAVGMGLVLGWTSPSLDSMGKNDSIPYVPDTTPENKEYRTWIGASLTVGAFVGSIASGPLAQTFGRKKALIMYGIPFTLGWITLTMAKSVSLLIVGRVILGLSAGLLSGTAPSYVVETSTISIRGTLGACFQLCVTIGILLVYLFGAFLEWRPLSGVCMIPTILMMICMFFMPESPSWLMSKKKEDEAESALRKLRSPDSDIDSEMAALREQNSSQRKEDKGFNLSIYKSRLHYLPLLLSLGLMIFQQFSGINAVMFYATSIFKDSGSSIQPAVATIVIGVVQVVATLISSFLVDRLGRKMLLAISGTLHVISTGALGLYYMLNTGESSGYGWVPLLSLAIFIIGFSVGFGPIPWLMVAEITPQDSRSATSALATTVNWGSAFLITKNFELLKDTITKQGTFFLFSGFSLLSIIFSLLALPETKGKSADEIQRYFGQDGLPDSQLNTSNNSEKVELEKLT